MKKYWIKSIKEIVNIRFNGFLSSGYIEYCGFYFEDVLVENELMGVVECFINGIDCEEDCITLVCRDNQRVFNVSFEDLKEYVLEGVLKILNNSSF